MIKRSIRIKLIKQCICISVSFFLIFMFSFPNSSTIRLSTENKKSSLIITVKTTFQNHITRISQIVDTWYKLSPENVYFITDSFDPILNHSLNGNLITTSCGSGHDPGALGCKLNQELLLMVKKNATWSCHVDDDNYVNIPMLKEMLDELDPNVPYYLGRTATDKPVTQNGRLFWFAIGGAGICFSNAAIQIMTPKILEEVLYLDYTKHDQKPDDWALGYMMDLLQIKLTEVSNLMSQYDRLDLMPLNAIKDTPILSFREVDKIYVNLPYFFLPRDDPYKFQTLHCFLFPNQCNQKLKRLGIDVLVRKKPSTYGSYFLPTVKAIIP